MSLCDHLLWRLEGYVMGLRVDGVEQIINWTGWHEPWEVQYYCSFAAPTGHSTSFEVPIPLKMWTFLPFFERAGSEVGLSSIDS